MEKEQEGGNDEREALRDDELLEPEWFRLVGSFMGEHSNTTSSCKTSATGCSGFFCPNRSSAL